MIWLYDTGSQIENKWKLRRFYCLNGTGHSVSVEQPDTFKNLVLEFIFKHTSLPFTKKNK